MARDRARSSFTVEVRRGRTTPVDIDPKRALWRGHDLAGEAARHEGVARAGAPAAAVVPADLFKAPVPQREMPRILPSLIEAPAPVEEASPPAVEERLPRVRRVRPRAARPAPERAAFDPDEVFAEDVLEDEVVADAAADALHETPAADSGLRLRRRPARGERVLRAGERWKRRLPRALW